MHMNNFYVRTDYRRHGIASRLMHELLGVAHWEGLGRIEWDCLEANTQAVNFYLRRYNAINVSKALDISLFMLGKEAIEAIIKGKGGHKEAVENGDRSTHSD